MKSNACWLRNLLYLLRKNPTTATCTIRLGHLIKKCMLCNRNFSPRGVSTFETLNLAIFCTLQGMVLVCFCLGVAIKSNSYSSHSHVIYIQPWKLISNYIGTYKIVSNQFRVIQWRSFSMYLKCQHPLLYGPRLSSLILLNP